MLINTIDEYLECKSKGIAFSINTSNKELLEFLKEDLKLGAVNSLKKYRINIENGKYFYDANSIIPFGKHRGNILKCIFKCDPNYVEWLLVNADSFCISENTIKIMQEVGIWLAEDLNFISTDDEFVLDIRAFEQDENGFPYSNKIREINFLFGQVALIENRKKLNQKLDAYTVLRGSHWENLSPVAYKGTSKKIKILV